MSAYLTSIMAISLVSALVSLLVPETARAKKYLGFVIGAVLLLCIAEPLTKLTELPNNFELSLPSPGTEENGSAYLDAVISAAEKKLTDDILSELFEKFRVAEKYTEVFLSLDASDPHDIRISELIITLKSYGALADARSIREYFSEKYVCEVKIAYE